MAKARKKTALLLLILFTFYSVNITCFPHGHHIGSFVIVHSHLNFGTSPTGEPSHSHTTEIITIISELSLFLTVAVFCFPGLFVWKEGRPFIYPKKRIVQLIKPLILIPSGRAPPVCQ